MDRNLTLGIGSFLILLLSILAVACGGGEGDVTTVPSAGPTDVDTATVTPTASPTDTPNPTETPGSSPTPASTPTPDLTPTPSPDLRGVRSEDDELDVFRDISSYVRSELVAEAAWPVGLAFAPDGRLFYNELRTGLVRIIDGDGNLLPEPFVAVEVQQGTEYGLIGLAIDPDFEENHHVYILFTAPGPIKAIPRIMRFTDEGNVGVEPTLILDLPETFADRFAFHVGGNIHFGPDGYLYVTVGDYNVAELAQDLSMPQGKILRINKEDGSAAPNNPFADRPGADPRVFALGLRNSWDFTFHPLTGDIYATENGDFNCDELNRIVAGGNYGWPLSAQSFKVGGAGTCHDGTALEAIHYFTRHPARAPSTLFSTVAPTGIEFISWDTYKPLEDSLLVCEFNTGRMRHFLLQGPDQDIVLDGSILVDDCRLDIAVSPGGVAYYSNESEIRRLTPQ
ncbi:MAG: PQQ-dependent sugar dehydrogenase [Dehalococcoidia bacterium]